MNNKKNIIPMYILFVYKKELLKNDYLKTLLITIIVKSLKKIIKIIWTDKKVTMACALSGVMSMSDILAALL